MSLYYDKGGIQIHHGDCLTVMPTLEAESFTACVTDPPYGLNFMGQDWDSPGGRGDFPMRRNDATNMVNTGASRQGGRQRGCKDWAKRQSREMREFQEWTTAWGEQVLRLLKPGGIALAFGGTRTFHRLTSGLEDAGFEIRDCIAYMYGSGFPKSHNFGKDGETWDGYGTALKPAWEPVIVAMKPLDGTFAQNALKHGVAGVNVDGCRIEAGSRPSRTNAESKSGLTGTGGASTYGAYAVRGSVVNGETDEGRWPANVCLDEEAARLLDEQTGELSGPWGGNGTGSSNGKSSMFGIGNNPDNESLRGQSGGASRFFYTSKVSPEERGSCTHPTMKPLDLMRWLLTMVTMPTGTRILDPFSGSGTTIVAAKQLGLSATGIELSPEYVKMAEARIEAVTPSLFSEAI